MISLLIPTINRSDFIIKYLIYLKENGFQGQVLIGDSSGHEHFCATKNFVKDFNCKFEIKQYSHPDMYPYQCINHMSKDINCPYSMFIPDDDILIPNTLKRCVSFLEANPDYSGVGGVAIACNIPFDDYNKINSVWRYSVRELDGETATDRVYDLMRNYSVVAHSLARTEQFKKRFPAHADNYDMAIGNELLPCAVLAAQGKVKMLNDLFVIRQIHQRRILFSTIFDRILQPHWATSTTFAIEYLAGIVAEIDSISYDEVYPVVKEAWYNYLFQASKKLNKGKKSFWRNSDFRSAIKSIPGLREIVQWLRSVNSPFFLIDDFTMPALLSPSSPYHEDFMPVYETITKKPISIQ